MTMSETILLAVCFGYVVGNTLSNLILLTTDAVKIIKEKRRRNKEQTK